MITIFRPVSAFSPAGKRIPDAGILASVDLEDRDTAYAELFGKGDLVLDGCRIAPPQKPEWRTGRYRGRRLRGKRCSRDIGII